mgnify:CR=1 FL=1
MTILVRFERGLEGSFREAAMRKYGYSKGAIKKALEAAVIQWIVDQKNSVVSSGVTSGVTSGVVDSGVVDLNKTGKNDLRKEIV